MKTINFSAWAILFAVALAGAFASCNDEEEMSDAASSVWGSGSVTKIVGSNLSKAKYVYTPSSSLRSASAYSDSDFDEASFKIESNGVGLIDANGNEMNLLFTTEDGDTVDYYSVVGVIDISDAFVVCGAYFYFSETEVQTQTEDGYTTTTTYSTVFRNLLMNKQTGAVYALPNQYDRDEVEQLYDGIIDWNGQTLNAQSDAQGNIYIYANYPDGRSGVNISKLNVHDPNNITIENILPSTEHPDTQDYLFKINETGVCAYYTSNTGSWKFKCPGGRIYPVSQLVDQGYDGLEVRASVFTGFNGSFYIAATWIRGNSFEKKFELYKLSEPGSNEITSEKVAEISDYGSESYPISNPVKKTHFWSNYYYGGYCLLEFDEATNELTQTEVVIPDFNNGKELFFTSEAVYIGSSYWQSQQLTKVPYADYSGIQKIDFERLGYSLYSIIASTASPELSFTGLRYLNSDYVIGVVDASGAVTCLENIPFVSSTTTLIRLN